MYPKLIPLADTLEQAAQQLGIGPLAANALAHIKQGHLPLAARVIVYGVPNADEKAALDTFVGQDTPSVSEAKNGEIRLNLSNSEAIELLDWTYFSVKHTPAVYTVAFVCSDIGEQLEDVENHVVMAMTGVPVATIVLANAALSLSKNAFETLTKEVINLKVYHLPKDLSLEKDVQFLLADRRAKDDLMAYTGLSFIKKTEELIAAKQAKMQEHFTVLKLQRQQDLSSIQKKTTANSTWQTTRDALNNHKEQFEKRLNKALENDLLPPQGHVYLQIMQQVETLDYLNEQKLAKSTALVIADDFMQQLKTQIRQLLTDYALNLSKEIRISTHFIENEVSQSFEKQNLSAPNFHTDAPTEADIKRLIDRILVFDRNFEYTIPAKKITEYMMGARMYYMVLMMGAGMLGVSGQISKNRTVLLPAIILVLGFGVYKMVTSKNQEDEEKMDKQIGNAKDLLKNETRRQIDNFMRNWQKLTDERYSDPVQTYIREADRQMNELNAPSVKQGTNDDKTRIQSALNSVLAQERSAVEWQRNQTTYNSNFQRIRTELTNNIKLYLQKWT